MAYGSHTRLVFETAYRSYDYFSTPITPFIKTANIPFNLMKINSPGSNFDQRLLEACVKKFVSKYRELINICNEEIPKIVFYQDYSILSKGRQTWSFIRDRNIPAAMALKETIEFLELNLKQKIGQSLGEMCQAILQVLEMSEIKIPTIYQVTVNKKKINRKTIVKIDSERLYRLMCTINTMAKSAERGKLVRRSIATPNMLLRPFVKIVEDYSSKLLSRLPCSGIPVGGQEKIAKLISIIGSLGSIHSGEVSGDIEKWNECLDPDAMRYVLTRILQLTGASNWQIELFQLPLLAFKSKEAKLGEGISVKNSFHHIKHVHLDDPEFPEDCDQYKKLRPLYNSDSKTIKIRLGMLMGMFNFLSTLYSLVAVAGLEQEENHVQSSDDFLHCTVSNEEQKLYNINVPNLYLVFRSFGINISPHKSLLIVPAGIGEFNSNYHHKEFVGNIGTELPAITPSGFNPSTDLTMGLRVIRNSLSTFQMTLPSAALALALFIKAYKHCYLVAGITNRTKFIQSLELDSNPLICQGGRSPFSVTTIHLDEICLKLRNLDLDEDYLCRIMNPENPFSGGRSLLTIKNENKRPVLEEDTSIGSIFKFNFARNRTVKNTPFFHDLKEEKDYAIITKAIESIMPEVQLNLSIHTGDVDSALRNRLVSMIASANITEIEKKRLLDSIDQEDSDSNSDSDIF
uniref:RNA-directed RNA polymerase catalytic subunit n=1 Tax=Hubei orthomyxo-like virus 4 TaxID=1923007 RepID=A0A1L3KKN7_9VIRU|nr:polymerase PB1 [Hubei orthomyxo-like virus 4]